MTRKWISDHLVRKPDEQGLNDRTFGGNNLTSTDYTLGDLKSMSRAELIEEILGTHSWDYLLANELVKINHEKALAKLNEEIPCVNLALGTEYRYTVFPHEGIFRGVLEYNGEEGEYVLQTYGEDRKKWEEDGMATFCFLHAAHSIEE